MWKDIKGWEGFYKVNENGDVLNVRRGNLVSGDTNNCGYQRVCLYNKNHTPQKQRFFRHRLVAEHFLENPNHLPEVNHKDLDKTNNNVTNLEWISRIDNNIHGRKQNETLYKPFKVTYANGIVEVFESKPTLARRLGITKAAIKFWLKGTNQGYLNYGIKSIQYI